MTEITAPNGSVFSERTHPQIDAGAFAWAALVTPFAFAASGVIALGVGVMFTLVAAVLSVPAYTLLGLPAFRFAILRFRTASGRVDLLALMLAGFVANIGSVPLAYVILLFEDTAPADAAELALNYALLGMAAAPFMALIFGWIYGDDRPDPAKPAPQPAIQGA